MVQKSRSAIGERILALFMLFLFVNVVFAQDVAPQTQINNSLLTGEETIAHKLERFSPDRFEQLLQADRVKLPRMSTHQRASLNNLEYAFKQGEYDELADGWEKLIVNMTDNGSDMDQGAIMSVMFRVFKESIDDINDDMEYFAAKLQAYKELGDELSEYVSEMHALEAERNNSGKEDIVVKIITCLPTRFSNNTRLGTIGTKLNRYKFDRYMDSVEAYEEILENETERTEFEAQNALKRQQQAVSAMRSLSRSMHDTAISIITR